MQKKPRKTRVRRGDPDPDLELLTIISLETWEGVETIMELMENKVDTGFRREFLWIVERIARLERQSKWRAWVLGWLASASFQALLNYVDQLR